MDFNAKLARRYWPKPDGGILMMATVAMDGINWGSEEGRAMIEEFRCGPEKKRSVPMR